VGDLFRRVADTKIGQIGSFQTGDKNILHHQAVWMSHALPLVNIQKTMENHNF